MRLNVFVPLESNRVFEFCLLLSFHHNHLKDFLGPLQPQELPEIEWMRELPVVNHPTLRVRESRHEETGDRSYRDTVERKREAEWNEGRD